MFTLIRKNSRRTDPRREAGDGAIVIAGPGHQHCRYRFFSLVVMIVQVYTGATVRAGKFSFLLAGWAGEHSSC